MNLPLPSSLFAAEVQYWRLDPESWATVLQAAVRAGLPAISTSVPWGLHEQAPGSFDFTGETDPRLDLVRFLELVRESGLKLAYRPGPYLGQHLDWGGYPRRLVLGREDMMVRQSDDSLLPGNHEVQPEGWQPSLLHGDFIEEVRIWFNAVDAVAREYTVANGGPIFTCSLDSDLSYAARDACFAGDYNACIIGPEGYWPAWLQKTYGTPDMLPYAVRYEAFQEVPPPRALGPDIESNLMWYFDWIRCKESMLARYLRTLRQLHDAAGLQGVFYYTSLLPHRPDGVPTNFNSFSRAVGGLVGYDFHCSPWMSYADYSAMARILKLMTATLPFAWSADFAVGAPVADLADRRVPRGHTEAMALMAMANGCQAINWSMFHDHEAWGDAPLSGLGHQRENFAALRQLLAARDQVAHWDSAHPVADLAIIYYRPWMWHGHLGDPAPCDTTALHVGEPTLWNCKAGVAVAEYEGLYRMIQQAGYTAATVDLVDNPRRLNEHKLVWLPGSSFIDTDSEALLSEYVERGGLLIVTGRTPRVDMIGRRLDFLGLSETTTAGRMIGPFLEVRLGKGRVMMLEKPIANVPPGQEDPRLVAQVRGLLSIKIGAPLVDVTRHPMPAKVRPADTPVEPEADEPLLVDAILHRAGREWLVYVVNLHNVALRVTLTFRDPRGTRLESLSDRDPVSYPIENGACVLDIDRKFARLLRLA